MRDERADKVERTEREVALLKKYTNQITVGQIFTHINSGNPYVYNGISNLKFNGMV